MARPTPEQIRAAGERAMRKVNAEFGTRRSTDEQIKAELPPMPLFLRESLYDYEQREVIAYVVQCVRAVIEQGTDGVRGDKA
jgi:hypothetical protein